MWPTALKNVQLIGQRVISREVFIFCNKSSAATSELAAPSTKQAKPFKEIPGPGGLYSIPGIGVAFYMKPFGDYYPQIIYKLFDKLHDKYGPTLRIGMLGKCVVTSDAEAFKTIFQNEGKYPQRTMGNSGIYAVYAERNNKESGLAVLNGNEWQNLRSATSKYMLKVNSATIYLKDQIDVTNDLITRMSTLQYTPQEFRDELFKYATESIGVVCFNKRLGCLNPDGKPISEENARYLKAIKHFFELFQQDMGLKLYRFFPSKLYRDFEKAANDAYGYGRVQIKENLARIEKQMHDGTFDPEEPNLILQLRSNPSMSLESVNAILLDLLAGGTDSTAKNIDSFLLNLALNPDKQEKLYNEIVAVVGPKGSELKAEHVAQMPYFRACMKESFRIRFPLGFGTLRLLPQDTVIAGYNVPKGAFVMVNSRRACMNPDYFESPGQYIPERWLRDEETHKRSEEIPSLALIPFGFGVRNCLGRRFAEQEIWLGITKIVQNFQVSVADVNRNYEMIYTIFGHVKDPIHFKFNPR